MSRTEKVQWLREHRFLSFHDGVPVMSSHALFLLTGADAYLRPVTDGQITLTADEVRNGRRIVSEASAACGSEDINEILYHLAMQAVSA